MTQRPRSLRGTLADAAIAAGATLLLLFSTAPLTLAPALALGVGVAFVLAGAAMLWSVPRPALTARLLASLAGLLLGYGAATWGTAGAWVALAAGGTLLVGIVRPAPSSRT